MPSRVEGIKATFSLVHERQQNEPLDFLNVPNPYTSQPQGPVAMTSFRMTWHTHSPLGSLALGRHRGTCVGVPFARAASNVRNEQGGEEEGRVSGGSRTPCQRTHPHGPSVHHPAVRAA